MGATSWSRGENQQGGNAGSIPADDLLAMSWRDFPWLISGRRCGYVVESRGGMAAAWR